MLSNYINYCFNRKQYLPIQGLWPDDLLVPTCVASYLGPLSGFSFDSAVWNLVECAWSWLVYSKNVLFPLPGKVDVLSTYLLQLRLADLKMVFLHFSFTIEGVIFLINQQFLPCTFPFMFISRFCCRSRCCLAPPRRLQHPFLMLWIPRLQHDGCTFVYISPFDGAALLHFVN